MMSIIVLVNMKEQVTNPQYLLTLVAQALVQYDTMEKFQMDGRICEICSWLGLRYHMDFINKPLIHLTNIYFCATLLTLVTQHRNVTPAAGRCKKKLLNISPR